MHVSNCSRSISSYWSSVSVLSLLKFEGDGFCFATRIHTNHSNALDQGCSLSLGPEKYSQDPGGSDLVRRTKNQTEDGVHGNF